MNSPFLSGSTDTADIMLLLRPVRTGLTTPGPSRSLTTVARLSGSLIFTSKSLLLRSHFCPDGLTRAHTAVAPPSRRTIHIHDAKANLTHNSTMSTFYDLKAELPGGKTYDFSELRGKVVLIVNVASKWCASRCMIYPAGLLTI